MDVWRMIFLSKKSVIFRFHVHFRGCVVDGRNPSPPVKNSGSTDIADWKLEPD